MALDVDLLRSSFELVLTRQPDVTHVFYNELFSRHPEAKQLFARNAPGAQEKMLADALVAVIDHLEDAPWLETTLAQLGAKHAEYGITTEMYGWVGESLLATFAEVAGSDWSPRLEAAWTDAYGAVCSLMLQGYPVAAQD